MSELRESLTVFFLQYMASSPKNVEGTLFHRKLLAAMKHARTLTSKTTNMSYPKDDNIYSAFFPCVADIEFNAISTNKQA